VTGRVPEPAAGRGLGHTTPQRVLVTGAASGLGEALTRAFRDRGDEVLATDRAEGVDLELDITSDDDWAAALGRVEERWGGLDILVNNAGVAGGGRIDIAGIDEWQWIVEVNLLGAVRGCRSFTPMFKRQRSGRIVNIASLAGLVHPAGMASYNAVKAGVVALTETLGHELSAYGVTAHAVCPSYFRTNLLSSLQCADEALGAVVTQLVETSPFTADEIASAVLAGLDAGDELILPDPMARAAYELKLRDRSAYDAQMRRQAARLDELGRGAEGSASENGSGN
jgi:NAD(P)-dependent dehydrogenase (short-subunit alcohol dehydrogenase family)